MHRMTLAMGIALLCASTLHADDPWPRHVIDNSSRGADGVRMADVNADGRPDIVTGWEEGGVTRLYLNPGPALARQPWPAVTVGRTPNVEDAVLADIDGDGVLDVITSCEGGERSIHVHRLGKPAAILDPAAWRTEPLPAARKAMMWMFTLPMQVDGRGGTDLVAAGKGEGAQLGAFIAPETPQDLAAWKWHPWLAVGWIMSLVAEDMDGDGDPDILATDRKGPTRGCFWIENPGGTPDPAKPWARHEIGGGDRECMFLAVADLDGDGLRDVLVAAKPQEILWFRRKSADGRTWDRRTIPLPKTAGGAKAVTAADIDMDGRTDIVFTCEGAKPPLSGVMWLRAAGPADSPAWEPRDVSGPEGVKYDLVELIDLDGDGDLDVLTCEEAAGLGVIWHENPQRSTR